jgi:hypothetical protein
MSKFYASRLEDEKKEKELWDSGKKWASMMSLSPMHRVHANFLLTFLIGRLWFNEGDTLLKSEGVFSIVRGTDIGLEIP